MVNSVTALCNPPPPPRTTGARLPCFFRWFFYVFRRIHRIWRCYCRTREVTQSAGSFFQFLGGWVLNACCGRNRAVVLTAKYIMIARRVLDCIKEQLLFLRRVKQLRNAFRKKAPYDPPRRIRIRQGLSPSCRYRWERALNHILDRILRILKGFFFFFVGLFKLSMRYMDLIDSLSSRREVREESVQDLFLNANHILSELARNEDKMHEALHFVGARYNATPLAMGASAAVGCTVGTFRTLRFCKDKTAEFGRSLFAPHKNRVVKISRLPLSYMRKEKLPYPYKQLKFRNVRDLSLVHQSTALLEHKSI